MSDRHRFKLTKDNASLFRVRFLRILGFNGCVTINAVSAGQKNSQTNFMLLEYPESRVEIKEDKILIYIHQRFFKEIPLDGTVKVKFTPNSMEYVVPSKKGFPSTTHYIKTSSELKIAMQAIKSQDIFSQMIEDREAFILN